MWYVSAHNMFVTGQWHLQLFLMEPTCQTQSIVEPRFCSWKSRSYGLLIGQVLPLHVSASKRSPKRMQLFLTFGIGFGFRLILDLPISEWCGFPDSTSLIGLRVNLHLTLQSWLNRSFTWSCSSETSIFWLKKNFLLSWFSDCWKSNSVQVFCRAI